MTGLEVGLVDVVVTASDSFGASTVEQGSLEVTNQPPRLIDAEIVPDSLERGQSVVVNIKAYDGHGVASVSSTYGPTAVRW